MWAAIQCKFYEPTTRLTKAGLDSFFDASGRFLKTESGPDHFGSRIIVSTTDHWSLDAEAALANDHISTGRIGTALRILNLRLTGMSFSPAQRSKINLSQCEAFEPRPYPSEAIDSAMERSASLDHGKLIMACGTGRIFTALRFTERVDDENGVKACILFLGPSISLLSQTPREWTAQGGAMFLSSLNRNF